MAISLDGGVLLLDGWIVKRGSQCWMVGWLIIEANQQK